jgi:hypothetical protein
MNPFKIFNRKKNDKSIVKKIHKTEQKVIYGHEMNEDEQLFFTELAVQMQKNGFDPALLKLHRLSSKIFNVDYTPLCYIGKIGLNPIETPDKYAVMKAGNKRAMRVFDTIEEAQRYMQEKGGDEIQLRAGYKGETFMQYLVGEDEIHRITNPTVQECIKYIPKWIAYLKYCKRTSD